MAYPIQTYDDLLNLIKASGRSFDLEQIEHAYIGIKIFLRDDIWGVVH